MPDAGLDSQVLDASMGLPVGSSASIPGDPAAGATLSLGMLRLDVPGGALEESTTLTVTVVDASGLPVGTTPYSAVYEFGPDGLEFAVPATLRIPFEGDASQAVFYWSNRETPHSFEFAPAAIEDGFVVARVEHFSRGFVGAWCAGNNCPCTTNRDCVDDGNLCNGTRYLCTALPSATGKKVCKLDTSSLVAPCDTSLDDVCNLTVCNPASGQCEASLAPTTTPCDDGDECTVNTTCVSGSCGAGQSVCACTNDSQCVDDDLCSGQYCQLTTHTCMTNPALTVVCDPSDNTTCLERKCISTTGACELVPVHDGAACAGTGLSCDEFTCAAGQCGLSNSTCLCHTDNDCDDGNACTAEYCSLVTGTCVDNGVVVCPTAFDTLCSSNVCNPATGLCGQTPQNNGMECSGSGPDCQDFACNAGDCALVSSHCGCLADTDCVSASSGALCAGTYFCNELTNSCQLNPSTAVACPTEADTACQRSLCNDTTGTCAMQDLSGSCDDGNPCTADDVCSEGVCQPGTNVCDCEHDSDCLDDGDLCTGAPYCDLTSHTCVPNTAFDVVCPPTGNECMSNTCTPATGLCTTAFANEGGSCASEHPCETRWCVGGVCAVNTFSCACSTSSDCAPFDTNRCDGGYVCSVEGVCVDDPSTAITCPAFSPDGCSSLACNPGTGACDGTALPNGSWCDDGNACTNPDQCISGACTGGPNGC